MAKQHKLSLGDETATVDVAGSALVEERHPYTVTAESGLFKNGKQYKTGDTIELTVRTAKAFIELGEVKEAK